MNWKVNLVFLFARLNKPIDGAAAVNIPSLRRKSERAARLGSRLFDERIAIKTITDLQHGTISLRIYRNSAQSNQRVLIYYHGGGFVLYGIESHDRVCRRLCQMNNCVVVSVGYRLAPEHHWPAAHEDAYAAIEWARQKIADYGGNPKDIIVAGDSAGGNLAACMAHRCKKENVPLRAQVLVYPWIDGRLSNPSLTQNGKGYLLERETVLWFRRQYSPKKEEWCLPELSPCFQNDLSGLPPALVLTAGLDPLLDDGTNYCRQLQDAGNRAQYRHYPALFHGFFNLPYVHPSALEAYNDIHNFLQTV